MAFNAFFQPGRVLFHTDESRLKFQWGILPQNGDVVEADGAKCEGRNHKESPKDGFKA